MPYLVIQTNVAISQEQHTEIMAKASRAMAEALSKPESYVMIALQPGVPMLFAGSDKPCAYLALKSIGLPHAGTSELSERFCRFMEETLSVPKKGTRVHRVHRRKTQFVGMERRDFLAFP